MLRGRREHCKHNIDIHLLALVLVFTVATLTSYTLSEWDLTPYDSVTARQSLRSIVEYMVESLQTIVIFRKAFNNFVVFKTTISLIKILIQKLIFYRNRTFIFHCPFLNDPSIIFQENMAF